VQRSDGLALLAVSPVWLKMHAYTRPAFDGSALLLFGIAVATVIGGAYWAANKERAAALNLVPLDRRDEPREVLDVTERGAYCWVVLASVALLLLFFFISQSVMYILIALFCIGGAQGLHSVLYVMAKPIIPQHAKEYMMEDLDCRCLRGISRLSFVCAFPAIGFAVWFGVERNASYSWVLQDILSVTLLLLIQRTIRLPNIKVSGILLTLAFLYDIFWVFISPLIFKSSVMITVATGGGTGENMPMLIRLPRFSDELHGYSLLGLGDIALPGLFISFLLRYDYRCGLAGFHLRSYFVLSVIGYIVGLALTDIALVVMESGQPALLYLVPCTLYFVCLVAWQRGHLRSMYSQDAPLPGSSHVPLHSVTTVPSSGGETMEISSSSNEGALRRSLTYSEEEDEATQARNERVKMRSDDGL